MHDHIRYQLIIESFSGYHICTPNGAAGAAFIRRRGSDHSPTAGHESEKVSCCFVYDMCARRSATSKFGLWPVTPLMLHNVPRSP
jgi:hypothetical protein